MPVETPADRRIWRISLEQIEAAVSDFLGPGRVKGNHQAPAFSRHVSMYLARHAGGWSYPRISRFYNGRRHTTVIAAIRRIERLRAQDEAVDALLDMLTELLTPETDLLQTETAKYSRPPHSGQCSNSPSPASAMRIVQRVFRVDRISAEHTSAGIARFGAL